MKIRVRQNEVNTKTKKKLIWRIGVLLVIILLVTIVFLFKHTTQPNISIDDMKAKAGDNVCVDVHISSFEDDYLATSFIIDFDQDKLEFVSIEQGNIPVESVDGTRSYPVWQYDAYTANLEGSVKTMYLDTTGGDNVLLCSTGTKKDALFRLNFKVKYTVTVDEELTIDFSQATFAKFHGDSVVNLSLENGIMKHLGKVKIQ